MTNFQNEPQRKKQFLGLTPSFRAGDQQDSRLSPSSETNPQDMPSIQPYTRLSQFRPPQPSQTPQTGQYDVPFTPPSLFQPSFTPNTGGQRLSQFRPPQIGQNSGPSTPPLFQPPITPTTGQRLAQFRPPQVVRYTAPAAPALFQLPAVEEQEVTPFGIAETDWQVVPPLDSPYPTAHIPSMPSAPPFGSAEYGLLPFQVTARHNSFPAEFLPPQTDLAQMPLYPYPSPAKKRSGSQLRGKRGLVMVGILMLILALPVLYLGHGKLFSPILTQQVATTPSKGMPTATVLKPGLNSITNNKTISPLLFGTNMALFHDNDEPILQSAATRQQLKDIGVRVIRMPTRATLKDSTMVAAAQAIKEIGAVPLVVINGPEYKDGLLQQSDQHLLSLLTPVFGKQPMYFEFGNESDLNGISADVYVQSWNAVIPALKQQFPTARFIGADNYQFTRRYLKTFLEKAIVRPDGVSWHEYTCSVHWTAAFCLANIDTWSIHVTQARAAMQEAIHTTLPIWITEWNYVSDQAVTNGQPIDDGKYNNPTFMHDWTTKAMQTLVANRVFAAMQYYATNQPMPLVFNNHIGNEGLIFQQEYQAVMVKGTTPPPVTFTYPTPNPAVNPNEAFSFENGAVSGWTSVGEGITQPTITTAQAFDGTRALQITLSNTTEDATPFLAIDADRLPSAPKAGQMISLYMYVENKAALVNAKIFVANPQHAWVFANSITLTPGHWNRIWYALPSDFSMQVSQIGLQFFTSTPGVSSNVDIDAINWQ